MECIYFTDFNEETKHILIQNEEIRHLRSLRIGKGDKILVSNGKGICAISVLINNIKGKYHFQVEEILKNYGELPYRLGLGVGILNDGKRFEFALEKAVELGITDFYPIISEYSEKKNLRLERLEKKVISALKQSKRSVLTNLHKPININDIHTISNEYDSVILAPRCLAGGKAERVGAAKRVRIMNRDYVTIVSGLPLNNFSVSEVDAILQILCELSQDGAVLSFFEYIGIRKLKGLVTGHEERARLRGIGELLQKLLSEREIRREAVWQNVPPAWVHHVKLN